MDTRKQYLPEDGMEFIDVQKSENTYAVFYKILNEGVLTNKSFMLKESDTKIDDQGEIELVLDLDDRYKVIGKNDRISYIKRGKKYYLENSNNIYYPHWSLIAAETINESNQIVTANRKDKIYCIWELDRNWNFNKDRLCSSFENKDMLNHEEEFKVDIDNDGFINKSFNKEYRKNKFEFILEDKKSNIVFKVDPIKMKKNKISLKFDDKFQIERNLELNIKLTKTGNGYYKNFPELVSIACDDQSSKCRAFKIGRFNNLWRLWIKTDGDGDIEGIDIYTEKIPEIKPTYWPIQYITIRNK